MKDPVGLFRTVVEALKELGHRAVIQAGWAGLSDANMHLPPFIKVSSWLVRCERRALVLLGLLP